MNRRPIIPLNADKSNEHAGRLTRRTSSRPDAGANKRKATQEADNPKKWRREQKQTTNEITANSCQVKESSAVTINSLPDEILLMILAHLSKRELRNVTAVSRRWSDVAHDRTLWYELSCDGDDFTTDELNEILRAFPLLRELTISNRNDCNAVLGEVCASNNALESLTIMSCRGSNDRKNILSKTMVNILKACDKLTALTIEGATFRSCDFYRYLLGDLCGRFKKLKLTVNPNHREWQCLYKAAAMRQLIIKENPTA